MTTAPATPTEAARFLNAYARGYSAGAFATPTAKEISAGWQVRAGAASSYPGAWHWWDGVGAMGRRLTRDSTRADFTGRRMRLPAGARVITHIGRAPGAPVPNLHRWDWIFSYLEDHVLTQELRGQLRTLHGVRISAASEIIGCWGLSGFGHVYPAHDQATIARLPLEVDHPTQTTILSELAAITQWHDDFPYYSDGSWAAVSLRGFNPGDPRWGIKPAEMSRAWWAEHPEAARYDRCDWTALAPHCPTLVNLVREVTTPWGGRLERVRLLRMAGRDGKGGRLARHTDITDRAAGTDDGKIIRLHIPLITHPDIVMTGWDLTGHAHRVHLPAWSMWYLDARKPHAVHNPTAVDRIHLVIDITATPAARAALAAADDHARPPDPDHTTPDRPSTPAHTAGGPA